MNQEATWKGAPLLQPQLLQSQPFQAQMFQFPVILVETPDIMEQKTAIPALAFLNSWPKESMSIVK